MCEVRIREEIAAPAARVWDVLSDFGGVDRWFPGAKDVRVEGQGVGALRRVPLGGAEIVERLESVEPEARRYSYSIVEAPMPVEDYLATVTVSEVGPERCAVDWVTTFRAIGVPEEPIADGLEGAYRTGLQAVARLVEGRE